MLPQNLRLESLLQSCPTGHLATLRDLVDKIRAPSGTQLLLRVMGAIETDLAALTDEVPCPSLQHYRNAASACIKLLAHFPALSDENFPAIEQLPADDIYKAYLSALSDGTWERQTLRRVFLYWLLLCPWTEEYQKALTDSLRHPPVLDDLGDLPDTLSHQLALVSEYFRVCASTKADYAALAAVTHDVLNQLQPFARAPDAFDIPNALKTALANAVKGVATPRALTPVEQLKRQTASLSTLIGQSQRHRHRPIIDRIPDQYHLAEYFSWLRVTHPALSQWAAIHTMLSTHANPLLAGPAKPRLEIDGNRDTANLLIHAPNLGKRHPSPTGEPWMHIQPQIHLPLPRRIVQIAARLRGEPGYDYRAQKSKLAATTNSWRKNRGVSITHSALQRVFPASLGYASTDDTLLHLLDLAPISNRDAGIYYFSPAASDIIRRYQHAVEQAAFAIGQSEWLADGWTDCPVQAGGFGASARPSITALQALVEFLKTAATRAPGASTWDNQIRAFNAEAGYLTILFLASTGARPVEEVFPEKNHWLPEINTLLLSDKDSLLYRSTRTLPITEKLALGVQAYQKRQHALERKLGRSFDKRLVVHLLSDDGTPLPPTIPNLKATIPGFAERWPWTNDILRHHFRSRLWELGCDASLLERAMGHLSKSQTLDAPHSMRRITDGLIPAEPYIRQLVDELGF